LKTNICRAAGQDPGQGLQLQGQDPGRGFKQLASRPDQGQGQDQGLTSLQYTSVILFYLAYFDIP